jgi:hypothetical protein
MKGVRCHYCAYCKQTLVRPCAKAKCQREANGDFVGGTTKCPKKRVKRVRQNKVPDHNASEPWLSDPEGLLTVGQTFLLSCLTDDLLDAQWNHCYCDCSIITISLDQRRWHR